MEANFKDEKRRRVLACNLRITCRKTCTAEWTPTRAMSESARLAILQRLMKKIHEATGFEPIAKGSLVVIPRKVEAPCFFIVMMQNEAVADFVRMKCNSVFKSLELWCGEDLTEHERTQQAKIKEIMTKYWGIEWVPNTHFTRALLKCTMD